MNVKHERLTWRGYTLFLLALAGTMLLCVCVGSVSIPLGDTAAVLWSALTGAEAPAGVFRNIILNVRLPRVLNVALTGAALSLCGAAMQGLLRNPLADGSTLGVSSGASLGAVIALAFGVSIPGVEGGGVLFVVVPELDEQQIALLHALLHGLEQPLVPEGTGAAPGQAVIAHADALRRKPGDGPAPAAEGRLVVLHR